MTLLSSFEVCVAGPKGQAFLEDVVTRGLMPSVVHTYPHKGDVSGAHEAIAFLCERYGIPCRTGRRPNLSGASLVFLVGWQFLIREGLEKCIVFHDSVLPEYRGFAPTVTALLADAREIGVTALRPDQGVDTGPIILQRRIPIDEDISIAQANALVSDAMASITHEIITRGTGELALQAQDHAAATYSIWRDEIDYHIDWRKDARDIGRQIRALGFPYASAKAVTAAGEVVTIASGTVIDDLDFVIRDPGKVWGLHPDGTDVICGTGMIRIGAPRRQDGTPLFCTIRTRFLTADTAWLVGR